MPWPKDPSAPAPQPRAQHPAAVPSSDTLRRAALNASWARDRRVARRRIALRWLLWAGWRIGLPMLLVLVLAVWLLGQVHSASMPVWLKPVAAGMPFNWSLSSQTPAAPASPPSENAPHGKEL